METYTLVAKAYHDGECTKFAVTLEDDTNEQMIAGCWDCEDGTRCWGPRNCCSVKWTEHLGHAATFEIDIVDGVIVEIRGAGEPVQQPES